MRLRYRNRAGKSVICDVGETPVVIGRAPECEIALTDDRVSRRHCEIRLWDGEYVLKDLRSQNGTLVNDERVTVTVLRVGDSVRVGSTTILFEDKAALGSETALRQIEDEMKGGKGYRTILKEIVKDIDKDGPAAGPR